uniref:Neprosin PEP catalytic domain-containing protein n=1 Tax=Brassica campestris TaxID=3711 RepID=M4DS15_BRACM
MRSSNKFILLILSTITLISLVTESRKTIPSQEKKRELEKLLNHINKPAIKSFQLKPTTIPKWTRDNNTSQKSTSLPFRQEEDIICPPGTVIIKRTTLEDLIQFQRLESLGLKPTSKDRNDDPPGHYTAVAQYYALNFGGKGNINVWDPQVEPDQYSLSSLYVQGGSREDFETISAGWIANKKGCYNTLCPGFVQVSRKFPLGSVARPVSKYGGKQFHLEISIYQERLTRDWWYVLKGEPVGYWPNPLFSYSGLAEGADHVWWGGEVFSADKDRISPIMGSGFVPQDDFGKAAYINGLRVIDRYTRKVMMPPAKDLVVYASSPTCYNVKTISRRGEYWSRAIFYGGPAGCTD